jgi:hypothetical protein
MTIFVLLIYLDAFNTSAVILQSLARTRGRRFGELFKHSSRSLAGIGTDMSRQVL